MATILAKIRIRNPLFEEIYINIFSKKRTGVQKLATFSDFSTTKGGFPIYFVISRDIYPYISIRKISTARAGEVT